MGFNFLTKSELDKRSKTDVQRELPESNPFLKNSFIGALITGYVGRIFEFYIQLRVLTSEMFPDTATGIFLERWGTYKGITRNPATGATGFITMTGTPSSTIPAGTILNSSDSIEYSVKASASISANVQSITSLVRVGSTVTATVASNHGLASGMNVTMAGAVETDYNGVFEITVTSETTFTYTIAATPSTPATGTITVSHDSASVEVESTAFGAATNQAAGSELTLTSPLAGVDAVGIVQFGELGGGTDIESDAALRVRILDAYRNPVSTFNVAAIERKARAVSGVTRIWVEEITPLVGQVTIYFTRDNDTNIIPSASEVQAVKDALLEIKPAHVDSADVIVAAPTPITVDFSFNNTLVPNTSTMQAAVKASLEAYFADETAVGKDLTAANYLSAIQNTVDIDTGAGVVSFTLSAPSGDVAIAAGELPVLGAVNF